MLFDRRLTFVQARFFKHCAAGIALPSITQPEVRPVHGFVSVLLVGRRTQDRLRVIGRRCEGFHQNHRQGVFPLKVL